MTTTRVRVAQDRVTVSMRVVIIGSPAERARLRRTIGAAALDIAGEAESIEAARAIAPDADAFLIAAHVPTRAAEGAPASEPADTPTDSLTPREVQVLELLAEGLPNKGIAARLSISDQTVKFHVASICGKLGATNRTDAVRRAVRRGLITL
jgi:DNA-binding NarL/FixJ family response regulator